MKVSMPLSYAGGFKESAQQAVALEKAGLDMVWVAEAYGFDGVSLMGYLAAVTETVEIGAAILPIYTRTPTLLAMTAAGVDALSDGRCILGLGRLGPPGHRGLPRRPLHPAARPAPARSSTSAARCGPASGSATRAGPTRLPLPPDQGTGLGKPLKLITHPVRDRIPIYVASLGPKNVRMTAEVADGWLPLFYLPEKADDVWGDDLRGRRRRPVRRPGPLEIVAGGLLAVGDDAARLRDLARPMIALYVGGMGAQGPQLLQRPGLPLRLRGRGRGDPGPVPRRQQGRGRRGRCPTGCSRPPTSAAPRATCATASPPTRRRA